MRENVNVIIHYPQKREIYSSYVTYFYYSKSYSSLVFSFSVPFTSGEER
jgi:hypothetical protein